MPLLFILGTSKGVLVMHLTWKLQESFTQQFQSKPVFFKISNLTTIFPLHKVTSFAEGKGEGFSVTWVLSC